MKHAALELGPEVQRSMDFLANHDLKALAYPVLAVEGPLSTTGLAKATSERAGVPLYAVKNYPETYLQAGFAEVKEGPPHRGVPRRLFEATSTDIGLPSVGAMLDWSEEHDIPLMTALSFTASNGSRAPINTVQLLEGMLSGANVGDIAQTRYKTTKNGWGTQHNIRLTRMVEDGLVHAEDVDPEVRILDPKYHGNAPFATLDTNQQNIYRLLQAAKADDPTGQKPWKLSELENLAASLGYMSPNDPELAKDFHARLVRAISTSAPNYSKGAVEKVDIVGRRYSIAPHFVDAAADLVSRVVALDRSPSARKLYTAKAHDIYNDPHTMHSIAQRGLAHSPFINANRS